MAVAEQGLKEWGRQSEGGVDGEAQMGGEAGGTQALDNEDGLAGQEKGEEGEEAVDDSVEEGKVREQVEKSKQQAKQSQGEEGERTVGVGVENCAIKGGHSQEVGVGEERVGGEQDVGGRPEENIEIVGRSKEAEGEPEEQVGREEIARSQ